MKNQEIEWLLKEKYGGVESSAFHTDCARLEASEPLAYIIGSVPFLSTTIYLDSKPLIPRPETEFWLEKAIVVIHNNPNLRGSTPKILDLCAGSGAIGVAIAKAIPKAHVTFAELDPLHLPTVEKNLLQNLSINRKFLEEQYMLVQSDLFENLHKQTFDYILSNPPYIDTEANTVEKGVLDNEPHLALFGGEGGMEIIARIIRGARAKLAPHGQLWLEHEPFQATAITELGKQHGFTVVSYPDQYDTVRYSVLTPAVPQ